MALRIESVATSKSAAMKESMMMDDVRREQRVEETCQNKQLLLQDLKIM
jgi:hypothetical protein